MNQQSEQEETVWCIVTEHSERARDTKTNFITVPLDCSGSKLVEEVGKVFCYDKDTFGLRHKLKTNDSSVIDSNTQTTLRELGITNSLNLVVVPKGSESLKKTECPDEGNSSESGVFVGSCNSTIRQPPAAPPPYALIGPTGPPDGLYSSAVLKAETGFVGLVNQAMTCYLNSLLQTLYMTPEFRNALYRWDFDGSIEEGAQSIPFQLQRLFLLLQTSQKPAVGTTELTTSFGWDSSEAWQQHDVQELCRVMFDALEQKFKETEQADLINTLYEGKLKDYVKCLECQYESAREDTFLDVPLVVRPFGSNVAYACVEEALRAFVTPETLQGSNQYFCEHCNKKCDAHKGLKFTKFPYLLTLQLKRFDFDPVTMHRIKLNDKVTFPEILDLKEFIQHDNKDDASEDTEVNCVAPETENRPVIYSDPEVGIVEGQCLVNHKKQRLEPTQSGDQETIEGEYIYELFSIMVHSGSANGGHYYAYIKCFADEKWYCFDDAHVTSLTLDDIQKTYGGGPSRGFYSSAYSSSTNAYMLMYRQIDKARNAKAMSVEEFPEHITTSLQNMKEHEERERQQRELDRHMCKIKLCCHHPYHNIMVEMRLKVHRDCTLKDATITARKIMDLENIPIDCCRLIKYDELLDSFECSFNSEDETMGELLDGVKSSYTFDLLLEIKAPEEEFQEYKPGGATVKVYVVDLENEEVSSTPSVTLRCNLSDTVEFFKSQVAKALVVDASSLRIVLESTKSIDLLEKPDNTLSEEGFKRSNKVFVEYKDQDDALRPFRSSKYCKILESYSNTVCILIGLPTVDKSFLEKLQGLQNGCQEEEPNQSAKSNSIEQNKRVQIKFRSEKGNWTRPDSSEESMGHFPSVGKDMSSGDNTSNLEIISPSNKKDSSKLSSLNEWLKDIKSSNLESAKGNHQFMLPPDDSSVEYDEGLGDSEIGDTCLSKSQHNYQAVHSDQSEDSSLTDSERTLIGDAHSSQNLSPDFGKMVSDLDNDSKLPPLESPDASILQPESDSAHSSSESNFQMDEPVDDITNPSSPEESAKEIGFAKPKNSSRNIICPVPDESPDYRPIAMKRYFKASPYVSSENGEKMLRIYVDKRITFGTLKKELEPFVGVESKCFKLYRLFSNKHEGEITRPSENLSSFADESRITIKLERPLRKGECKVKIYQLCINESEPSKFLTDSVFAKGSTVLTAKKDLVSDLKSTLSLEIPLNRCRLRKKSWKNPGTVFLDHQCFDKDITITSNWEVFIEKLEDDEPVTSANQLSVFIRRWHPSKYELGPFQEIVLDNPTSDCLKSKLIEMSQIPEDSIEFAKVLGTFRYVSVLSIHKGLDWLTNKSTITLALSIGEDGFVVYYRDGREELKKLTEEEKREITNKENASLNQNKIQRTLFSPRKEKALKIYTLDSFPSKSSNSISTADTDKSIVPDLD